VIAATYNSQGLIASAGNVTITSFYGIEDASVLTSRIVGERVDGLDEEGERDIQAEVTLALAGFPVRCLEQDRSGWLIGAIETEKGLITYG
jgi:hypothetical protein